jgi:acyl-CoA synthetase (AMP-forming)/AMP-acid ligase II
VALVLPNGPELAVAFVGVACAAACAPLNPAYRQEEFDFYLADLGAKAVIVMDGLDSLAREAARKLGIAVLELTPESQQPAGLFTLAHAERSSVSPTSLVTPEDVALVLHTSGTTSRPKIVPLSHRNLCASARNIAHTLNLSPKDRCLNVMPLFHIHGLVGALLSSLQAGAGVVCTPGFDEERFFDWLNEFRPTWYTAVPTIHQSILTQAPHHRDRISRLPLRFIRSSSSSLAPRVMEQLESAFNVPVIESYGMTEAAHQMCSNPLPPGQRKPGSVGPAAGPDVAIMDENGNLLPAESIGEVVIRGENVTTGYANNPAANSTSFTSRWFRTGDQGRLDCEGYLFLTGRLKEIINRGGEKVSPREIDEVLLDHPAVKQAVAFAVPHDRLGEDVAAAVVVREDRTVTEQELRDYAFSRLADFKVPSQIVFVDQIPKGPTGKFQRIGLHEKLAGQLERQFMEPVTATEALVVRLFSEVLNQHRISVTDNFFALGGDSLRATQFVSRVRRDCRIELPIITVFHKPTPRGLAAAIDERMAAGNDGSLSSILYEIEQLTDDEAKKLL